MDTHKVLFKLFVEGLKNPNAKIIETINKTNPFMVEEIKVSEAVALLTLDTSGKSTQRNIDYLSMYWAAADKSQVRLENIKEIANNTDTFSVGIMDSEEGKPLKIIIDYIIKNRTEDLVKILLKDIVLIEDPTKINIFDRRFEKIILSGIIDSNDSTLNLKKIIDKLKKSATREENEVIEKFKRKLLFYEFIKNNEFINFFYSKNEGEKIFIDTIEREKQIFVKARNSEKNQAFSPRFGSDMEKICLLMEAGLKMKIKNKKFDDFINKILRTLFASNYGSYGEIQLTDGITEIIEKRQYLKIDQQAQKELGNFIEKIKAIPEKKMYSNSIIKTLIARGGGEVDEKAKAVAGLEKALIDLLNQDKKKSKANKI